MVTLNLKEIIDFFSTLLPVLATAFAIYVSLRKSGNETVGTSISQMEHWQKEATYWRERYETLRSEVVQDLLTELGREIKKALPPS